MFAFFLAICRLRLDFETFSLLGTGVESVTGFESQGGMCMDTFDVTVIIHTYSKFHVASYLSRRAKGSG